MEYLLISGVLFLPVLFAYLGVKTAIRLALALRRRRAARLIALEGRSLLLIGGVNFFFGALFLYGVLIEANWVELVHQEVPVEAAVSLRLVHVSDLHIEGFGRRERIALDVIRAEKPDLICLTGDYTSSGTGDEYVEDARRFMMELDAPLGVFAVPGNWDFDLHPIFERTAVKLLVDGTARIQHQWTDIVITGTSFSVPPPQSEASLEALTIYLQHSPDFLEEASRAGYDLYLAGHTHGGSVRIPGFGAIVTMSRFWRRYEAGLYRMGKTHLYVTRGLGLEGGWAPRIRLFCRPEVTVLKVVGKEGRGGGR